MRRIDRSSPASRTCVAISAVAIAAFAHGGEIHSSTAHSLPPDGLAEHRMLEDPFNRAFLFDKLELHDADNARWDMSAWAGHTFDRFAVRSEGERANGATQRAELQLLFTHAIARWWDVVAGARSDFEPGPSRNWAAFGVQGLAPYRFEIEATAFVGSGGDLAARFKSDYDVLITNRLILQPHLELDWYGQTDRERGVGAGLSSLEAGLRLRYELRRELAPYVGLVRERRYGASADFARAAGFAADDTSFVLGVRLRF